MHMIYLQIYKFKSATFTNLFHLFLLSTLQMLGIEPVHHRVLQPVQVRALLRRRTSRDDVRLLRAQH